MSNVAAKIADNVDRTRDRIAAAAEGSGRAGDEITMVAVTKYVGVDQVRALVAAGCRDIGENRPQELWRKAEALEDESVAWHLVGHLQRNKVRRTLPLISMLHSGDSQRLLAAVDAASVDRGQRTPVLVEVNVSGDPSKHGFQPDEVETLLSELVGYHNLEIRGLMTMAGLEGGREQARVDFVTLRNLRDRLRRVCPPRISLDELSMGMSRDFDVAIEAGATIVRIGSALFEGIQP